MIKNKIMNCPACNFENSIDSKQCNDCGLTLIVDEEVKQMTKAVDNTYQTYNDNNSSNKIANILKTIGWITIVLGFITAIILWQETEEFQVFIIWFVASGLSAIVIFAFSEIVQILHDIRAKLK